MLKQRALIFFFVTLQTVSAQAVEGSPVRIEVEEFFSAYLVAFATQQTDALVENYMLTPFYMRNGSDTVFLEHRADVVAYLNSVFAALAGESYARSELLNTSICVLTDSTAIVSTAIRRFDSNGAVLLETGATYALVKFDNQWRFTMASTHDVENIVSCHN